MLEIMTKQETVHKPRAPQLQTIVELIEQKRWRNKWQKAHSPLFFAIGLVVSLSLVIAAFEWSTPTHTDLMDLGLVQMDDMEVIDIPITELPPPPLPENRMVTPKFKEVKDEKMIKELDVVVDIEMTEQLELNEIQEFTIEEVVEEKAEEIFTVVETPPSPPGGLEAFYAFIGENLKYPQAAMRLNLEGRTYVQFVVEKDGSLTDIQVVKGFHETTNAEAIRVLKISPKWNPGKQRGRPVRVRYVIPIRFKIHQSADQQPMN